MLLEDIYEHIRTFVPRHATIIKVRRVSVAHLNHAAPYDRRTAPRVSDNVSAYFHWSRGTCSLNATSAFIPARLLQRGGNSNRDTARCEIRTTTGASRNMPRRLFRPFVSLLHYPLVWSRVAGSISTCARTDCATFAGRAGDYEIFYYTAVTRSSHNREWHRRLSTYIRETLPGMVSNGHFTRPISACFHAF